MLLTEHFCVFDGLNIGTPAYQTKTAWNCFGELSKIYLIQQLTNQQLTILNHSVKLKLDFDYNTNRQSSRCQKLNSSIWRNLQIA